jgi:hypothetical protein
VGLGTGLVGAGVGFGPGLVGAGVGFGPGFVGAGVGLEGGEGVLAGGQVVLWPRHVGLPSAANGPHPPGLSKKAIWVRLAAGYWGGRTGRSRLAPSDDASTRVRSLFLLG